MLNRSVKLNGILLPIATVESALARYADNLVVWNDHPQYSVSLSGSMTLVHYQGKYLALCCNHQLGNQHPPEQVSLLDRDGRMCTSSGGMRSMTHKNETDFTQLIAFDFTEPCAAIPSLSSRFFNLQAFPPDLPSNEVLFFITAGFPTKDQNYRMEEARALDLVKRIGIFRLGDKERQPSDEALLEITPLAPLDFDPDGLSGGSAFVVVMQNGEPTAYFSGLIMRGGRTSLQILKIGFIRRFLNQIIGEGF